MLIEDVIGINTGIGVPELLALRSECSQFLREAASLPLLKALPTSNVGFRRVKVRQRKGRDNVAEVFDRAFSERCTNLRQRSVFAYPTPPLITENTELYYIFPINGYKCLYSKEVTNSGYAYSEVIDTLFEQFSDTDTAVEIVTDLLKYTYTTENLHAGMASGSEIILYGIPYYYAVRAAAITGYNTLVSSTILTHKGFSNVI